MTNCRHAARTRDPELLEQIWRLTRERNELGVRPDEAFAAEVHHLYAQLSPFGVDCLNAWVRSARP